MDCHQARSNLAQTEAQIPQLKLAMRQACDRLCVLLGRSPADLEKELGVGPIPSAPEVIAVGIPGRPVASPPRRSAGRASGVCAGGADWHRRGGVVPDVLHQRQHRL